MTSPFTSSLISAKAAAISGGYASGSINPAKIADELFGGEAPGPWLTCYMLRRFGWPNEGSDPYKNFCTWTLTTPMDGLYLAVTPYLGGSNLHFAVRFSEEVGRKLESDPGRDSFLARKERSVMRWWRTEGSKLYVWGMGKEEGDEDELVHAYGELRSQPGMVCGLWRRTTRHNRRSAKLPDGGSMLAWWLAEKVIKTTHPEYRLPTMTKREKDRRQSRFQIRAIRALRLAMADLLRPTNIRDLSFNVFGDVERTPAAIERSKGLANVAYFPGAGCTPEYWFGLSAKDRSAYEASAET